MKIQHLHLSDAHITNENTVNFEKITKIVQALKSVGSFDECTIIFSGDIANSGQEDQYKIAKAFIGKLISEIKTQCNFSKYINVCVTPGNHDMLTDMNSRPREKFWKAAKKEGLDSYIDEELKLMQNFMNFAQHNSCFKNNQLINRKLIFYGENKEYLVCYNLINSSPFSLKDEKGIHYLPKSEIEKLYVPKNAKLNITVMHHGPEWFFTKVKDELEKALYENSSIICMGHEHNGKCELQEIEDETGVLLVRGAEFSQDGSNKSEFFSILFDSETYFTKIHKYTWDDEAEFYRTQCKKELHITPEKNGGKKQFALSLNFKKTLYSDGKENLGTSYREYFVFPTLSGSSYDEYRNEERINSMDDFIKLLTDKRRIFIKGDDRIGKTTLMKEIFFELSKKYVPLSIFFESGDKIKLNTILKHAFQEQYSNDPKLFELYYEQLPFEQRAIVVDGIHLVKEGEALDEFWNLLKNKFSIIVVSGRYDFDFDILAQVKDQIDVQESYYELQLNGLFAGKRKELISKVYPIIKKNNSIGDKGNEIELLNNILKQSLNFFRINPSYIIQFVSWAHDNKSIDKGHNWAIFSKVFEANIVKAIEVNSSAVDVGQIMLITGKFALYLFFKHRSIASYDEFKSIVEAYNEDHGESVTPKLLLDQLISAKIIKRDNDELNIKFVDNNYLSFFIAKETLRKFNNDRDTVALQTILDKICFGINGDILLFIVYMTENTEILLKIHQTALSHLNDWEEYSIENGNLKFLENITTATLFRPPTSRDKEENEENNIEQEIEQEQKIRILETKDVLDYDDEELEKENSQFRCAVKYTELLCKGFAGFSYLLKKDQKDSIIDAVYRFPNKIVFFLLKNVDENFEEYVETLENFMKENKNYIMKGRSLTREQIVELIERVSMGQVLAYFDMAAFYAANNKTINLLNNYKELPGNFNYRIQNILMLSNVNKLDEFMRKTDDLYKALKGKKKSGEYYISQIVSHHIITKKLSPKQQQRLSSKYFSPQGSKAILYRKTIYDKRR
ncbi:MAG: metallophosphoesterase [Dehalococcoidales bacterium]